MTKRFCDRCGAEINPTTSATYVGTGNNKHDIYDCEIELCVSCAFNLKKWLKGDEDATD